MRFMQTILLLLASGGCAGNPWGLQLPRSGPQGTLEQQRSRAALHDPYPDAYAGPLSDGMRPREFQTPLPEPVKNRGLKDPWWQY
jgi:hypothetical protein